MKKLLVIIAVMTLFLTTSGIALADSSGPLGPATDSGDGIPNDDCLQYGPNGSLGGIGPAPNSGDGIPDGSGF
jgi:hypothetical protein